MWKKEAIGEYRITFYSNKNLRGISSSGFRRFSSDEEAIETAKKEIVESDVKRDCYWGSVAVEKYNGYWPQDCDDHWFKGTIDVIWQMNYDRKTDDDSPRTFYKLIAWRSGLSQDCQFEEVILRPSETHFEGGRRVDKDGNRVCTWSEMIDAETYSACD